jgi:hypothetical protein
MLLAWRFSSGVGVLKFCEGMVGEMVELLY